ncbi:unnamed protein product [Parnassius mnemosyne]|uniref:Uncharacterized protein n=1 Tax=Parnassius mnemosyne TaxID=213953 RepID=A0AAV1M4H1_9NEOP
MYTSIVYLLCGIVGTSLAYYDQREAPYYTGPNDPYQITNTYNIPQEKYQRLFWGNGQGSNQVGGTGFWATLTNKFPFLGNMFGRMELPSEYGVPNRFNPSTQYTAQDFYPAQVYQPRFRQQVPFSRDVAITDDAVIVTPPQVPIASQPAPIPQPAPVPAPEPSPGYNYEKPQYRLELPNKFY